MATRGSLSQSMDNAVKHYASLFKLPSFRKIVLLQALICVGGGLTSVFLLLPSSEGLINGFGFGLLIFFLSLLSDWILSTFILRQDPIYDMRRTPAVSVFCWAIWFLFVFIGVTMGLLSGLIWWVRFCLLGFSVATMLRLIIFEATASIRCRGLLATAFLQPFFCIPPFLLLWTKMGFAPTTNMLLFLMFSPIICFVSSHYFLSTLNRVGEQILGIPSLALFKAFMLNWVADLNNPFEELLERLSEERDIKVSILKFESVKTKAVMVIPSVHPGPFKNIGSSILPSLIKSALERKLDYIACVPLGAQGHELDLASQSQNRKVISQIIESMDFAASKGEATPFVRVNSGLATACCQVFGDFAIIAFSLAPNTTEDLPQELGQFVQHEARKRGLAFCIVINAHNSIDEIAPMPGALNALESAATVCLEKTNSLKQLPFDFGAATILPEEFSLEDGMGAGGISVFVVRVGEQKTAYVVLDGNNMISGLREKILSNLKLIGINEGEILTTDTHSVSAIILGKRGYHPIGEAIDHEKLIDYIKDTTITAVGNLKPAKAECHNILVSHVKVIGEKRLETLSLLIDKVLREIRKAVIPVFVASGLLLMLLLLFI